MLKYVLITSLCLIAPLSNYARADDINVATKLSAATIYAGSARAKLTRDGSVQLPSGKHTLVFEGLPVNLMADSLRAEGKGQARVVLGALSHKVVNNTELVSKRERDLNAKKEELEAQKRVIETELAALTKKQRFLDNLNKQASTKISEEIGDLKLDPAQWLNAANALHESTSEILNTQLAKQIQIEEINKQVQKIKQDLAQLRTGQKQTYKISLPVEVKSGGNFQVALDYQIPNVSWRPVYDARLNTNNGDLSLTQYGSVTQRTGEDWKDIALTLSTAQPSRGATVPNLSPMWVNLGQSYHKNARGGANYSGMVANQLSAPMAKMEMAEMDFADAEVLAAAPAEQIAATINNGGFNAEFMIPGAISIPADGTESKVLISPFETENKLEVHIKPQVSSAAFLVANATVKGDTPILSGPVSLFRDGSYVGQTHIPMLRPGKDYDLSFGIDDQIDVAYKTLKDERGEAGVLIGKSKTIERQTITEIQNLRKTPVDIVVMQSIPVSKNKEIEIEIDDDATTQGFEKDRDNIKGLTSWSFTLDPTAKKDIELGWSVSWPKDQNITGLR